MPDREKVINAIECCIDGCLCAECDYEGIEGCWNKVLLTDALALLKEKEAVAIVWKFGFPHCPVCGQMLPEGDAVKYCLHCGRSVK